MMKNMKFPIYSASVLGLSSLASAFSLYDTAPMVGVPESKAVTYSAAMRFGYDTNPSTGNGGGSKDAQYYVNASLNSSFSDVESVDKMSYSARLGGTHYLGSQKRGGRKYYGDSSLDASLSHSFSMRSQYAGSVHLSYMPEPGYDNGFSSAGMRGDTLSWHVNNRYSEAIDARWSWNVGASFSGTDYQESTSSEDDRRYYSGSMGINYRDSDRMTYTSSLTYREEPRSYGLDSRSAFASLGIQYALSTVSSASVSTGAQCKMMDHRNTINPTLDIGYRRKVADGLSMNAYVKYSDENVDNYNRSANSSYRSSGTWRVGAYGTYVLSPDVSYVFRMQIMQTRHRKPTDSKMKSATRSTLNPSLSMNYNFTPSVTGTLTASYTYNQYKRGEMASSYERWQFSAGLNYHF